MMNPAPRERANWLEQLTGEVRSALRGLRKDSWFSVGIIVTVATA